MSAPGSSSSPVTPPPTCWAASGLGDTGRERDRRFVFATAYDRGLVIAAARTLLARIAPVSVPPGVLAR